MNHEPDRHLRRSLRLKGYAYTQTGAYFVTVCTQGRTCLFGDSVDGEIRLNDAGRMVHEAWHDLPVRYPAIETDAFVVMPNHVHGIIVIVGAPLVGALSPGIPVAGTRTRAGTRPAPTLGDIVGTFKSFTMRHYIDGVRRHHWPAFNGAVWQRNYYEHIVRNEEEMDRIRQYIVENPVRWADDEDNPANIVRG